MPQDHMSALQPADGILTRTLAVPSWVMCGTIVDNARFVRDAVSVSAGGGAAKVSAVKEIGLCFFEAASCLAYTDDDLPPWLADLPFSWHVHLPMDLPWEHGGAQAARCAVQLMDKLAFLGVQRAVLHPPCLSSVSGGRSLSPSVSPPISPPVVLSASSVASSKVSLGTPQEEQAGSADAQALREFVAGWEQSGRRAEDLLVENIRECDLTALENVIQETGCSVCLDTGHILAYGQETLLSCAALLERVRMVHLNAPAKHKPSKHLPLTALSGQGEQAERVGLAGRATVSGLSSSASVVVPQDDGSAESEWEVTAKCLRHVPKDAVLMLEVFDWQGILESLPVLERLLVFSDSDNV